MSRVSEVDSFHSNVIALAAWPEQTFAKVWKVGAAPGGRTSQYRSRPALQSQRRSRRALDVRPLNGVAWRRRALVR